MLKAITLAPGILVIEESERAPQLGPGEVRIQVEAVGICGSDAHIFEGTHSYLLFPQVQGHEVVGRVDEIGQGVEDLMDGERVVLDPMRPCGACVACRRGRGNVCTSLKVLGVQVPGGLQEQLVVEARFVHRVGDLSLEAAVFVEPLSIAIQSIARSESGSGDSILVLGAGSIGRAVAMVAADRNLRVLVADHSRERRALARTVGADADSDIRGDSLVRSTAEFTNGEGFSTVIDTTGSAALIQIAVDLTAPAGTVVVVGISPETLQVPVALLSRKEVSLHGSRNSVGAFPEAIRLARNRHQTLAATVTDRFSLRDAGAALDTAARSRAVGKIIVFNQPDAPS